MPVRGAYPPAIPLDAVRVAQLAAAAVQAELVLPILGRGCGSRPSSSKMANRRRVTGRHLLRCAVVSGTLL